MARRSNSGRPPGPNIGRPPSPRHVTLEVPAETVIGDVADQLAALGCLNPRERAVELITRRVTRFYRPDDDATVTVTASKENGFAARTLL